MEGDTPTLPGEGAPEGLPDPQRCGIATLSEAAMKQFFLLSTWCQVAMVATILEEWDEQMLEGKKLIKVFGSRTTAAFHLVFNRISGKKGLVRSVYLLGPELAEAEVRDLKETGWKWKRASSWEGAHLYGGDAHFYQVHAAALPLPPLCFRLSPLCFRSPCPACRRPPPPPRRPL